MDTFAFVLGSFLRDTSPPWSFLLSGGLLGTLPHKRSLMIFECSWSWLTMRGRCNKNPKMLQNLMDMPVLPQPGGLNPSTGYQGQRIADRRIERRLKATSDPLAVLS